MAERVRRAPTMQVPAQWYRWSCLLLMCTYVAVPNGTKAQGRHRRRPPLATMRVEARALAGSLPTDPRQVLGASPVVRAQARRCIRLMFENGPGAQGVAPPRGLTPPEAFAGAWCFAVEGQYAPAADWAAFGAGLQPGPAVALLHRIGVLALLDGNPLLAERVLARGLRARPRDPLLYSELGGLQLARGDAGSAARSFRRGLEATPADIPLRMDLAGALLALGRPDEAVTALQRVLTSEPNSGEPWLLLARAALEAERLPLAERAAERAVASLGGQDPRGLVVLGNTRMSRGDRRGATSAFRRALERAPQDLAAQVALAGLNAPSSSPREGAGLARPLASP